MIYGAVYGATDRIRTCDSQLRKLILYPTELRSHVFDCLLLRNSTEKRGEAQLDSNSKCNFL